MARLFARTLAACASAAALVVVCSGTAHAQAVKGGLLGNIVDQSGFALPGVSVTITEVRTNISYTSTPSRTARLKPLSSAATRYVPSFRFEKM